MNLKGNEEQKFDLDWNSWELDLMVGWCERGDESLFHKTDLVTKKS